MAIKIIIIALKDLSKISTLQKTSINTKMINNIKAIKICKEINLNSLVTINLQSNRIKNKKVVVVNLFKDNRVFNHNTLNKRDKYIYLLYHIK